VPRVKGFPKEINAPQIKRLSDEGTIDRCCHEKNWHLRPNHSGQRRPMLMPDWTVIRGSHAEPLRIVV
jgi:hypothetical protein